MTINYEEMKIDLIKEFIQIEYVERFAVKIHDDITKQATEMYRNDPSAHAHIDYIVDKMITIFKEHSKRSDND